MEFRIADTFTSSLARLTGEEQKAVKTSAFDLQMNPANPGLSFHKLDKAKDKRFWSVRVNRDIRLIVHKTENGVLLCYVDHHDKAYDWAERRKLEIHPKTGAAQLVEVRETVQQILVPVYINEEKPANEQVRKLFTDFEDEKLLSYGVPEEWLNDVKEANEDTLLTLVDYLPAEAAEALLELATGGMPVVSTLPSVKEQDAFTHPDAQRRFRTIENVEELQRALDFPWDKWATFLHPAQKQWVERTYNGPARISGSAGTGKTIVALHRAVFLAKRNPDARVLLTTFSTILANSLKVKLRRLISNEPRLTERIDVAALNDLGKKLYKANIGSANLVTNEQLKEFIKDASSKSESHKFELSFLLSEWLGVVDVWQLKTWEEYKAVKRLGRKTRLPEQQREILWSIFEKVNDILESKSFLTFNGLFHQLTGFYKVQKRKAYEYVIVDEAQDISPCQLKFLLTLGNGKPEALFFTGDTGQRIFQQPFSWKSLGVDIRGRSKTLYVNYRTSHQIRRHADNLLDPEITDLDGNAEERDKTISLFNGPEPEIRVFKSEKEEFEAAGLWVKARIEEGVYPHEIGIFFRSQGQVARAIAAIDFIKFPYTQLDDGVEPISGKIALSTMHLAKGLEFKTVVVIACDDEIVPLQSRIEGITDTADLEEVYNSERHLLYVACTRAREHLLVTAVNPASEFLQDLLI